MPPLHPGAGFRLSHFPGTPWHWSEIPTDPLPILWFSGEGRMDGFGKGQVPLSGWPRVQGQGWNPGRLPGLAAPACSPRLRACLCCRDSKSHEPRAPGRSHRRWGARPSEAPSRRHRVCVRSPAVRLFYHPGHNRGKPARPAGRGKTKALLREGQKAPAPPAAAWPARSTTRPQATCPRPLPPRSSPVGSLLPRRPSGSHFSLGRLFMNVT